MSRKMNWNSGSSLAVSVMAEEDEAPESQPLSATMVKENRDFRQFTERMESSGKVYFLVDKAGTTHQHEHQEEDGGETTTDGEPLNKQWLDCCLRDYLQRKRQFAKRCGSQQKVAVRIAVLCSLFVAVLWFFWPLWNFLIDVDAGTFFKTLGIAPTTDQAEVKRAYREQARKWHPDRNPSCGDPCREQMQKIQQAYDILLSRRDHTAELANRYRDELLQVRSLIFFRVYEMASNAAQEIFNIVTTLWGGMLSDTASMRLRIASSISTIVFFTAYEMFYVGGFNIFMIFQVFFLIVSMSTSTARSTIISKMRKAAYVDLLGEAAVMIVPLGAVGGLYVLTQVNASDRVEEMFRVAFGCFYVLAYLYHYMPNLYDNLRKRSCTVTMNYFRDLSVPVVTMYSVASAELGFLVDDLFTFTCRVPAPFRVIVFVSHFIYLCQFAMLPWESPLRSRKGSKKSRAAQKHSASAPSTGAQCELGADPRRKTLSHGELKLVANLDSDPVDWRLASSAKYRGLQLDAFAKYAIKHKDLPLGVEVAPCADFDTVGIVLAITDPPAAGSNGKPGVRHEIVRLIKDPPACRQLALFAGPLGMLPVQGTPRDVPKLKETYIKTFGAQASQSPSTIWRRHFWSSIGCTDSKTTFPSSLDVCALALFAIFLTVLVLLLGSGRLPTSQEAARSAALMLHRSQQPLSHLRFSKILQPEHPFNAMSVGLMTLLHGRLTLTTIDIRDAVRQFRLYHLGGQQRA